MIEEMMPAGGFWYGVNGFINWLFSLIPSVSLPDGSASIFATASNYTQTVSYYVPVDILLGCIVTVLAFWLACLVISALLQLL